MMRKKDRIVLVFIVYRKLCNGLSYFPISVSQKVVFMMCCEISPKNHVGNYPRVSKTLAIQIFGIYRQPLENCSFITKCCQQDFSSFFMLLDFRNPVSIARSVGIGVCVCARAAYFDSFLVVLFLGQAM
jgi:hypothetical protein